MMQLRRRSPFLEKFGSWMLFLLFAVFVWWLISEGVHRLAEFSLLFPMGWIDHSPLGPLVNPVIAPFSAEPWWMWVEIAATIVAWLFLYFLARGIFYAVRSMEGPSMWVLFVACIVGALLFFAFILAPAFRQLDVWWTAWPGVEQTEHP